MPSDIFTVFDVEQVVADFLRAQEIRFQQSGRAVTANVYTGAQNLDTHETEGESESIVKTPCIVDYCAGAPALAPEFAGNWEPEMEVHVSCDASDCTSAEHKENTRKVWRHLITDRLAQDLTEFSQGRFYSARSIVTGQSWLVDGNCWTSVLTFVLRQACFNEIHNE